MVSRRVRGREVVGRHDTDNLVVGVSNGRRLSQIRVFDSTLDPTSVDADQATYQTFTVSGLTTNDVVYVMPPQLTSGIALAAARVDSVSTLGLYFVNATAGGLDPSTSAVYRVIAFRTAS